MAGDDCLSYIPQLVTRSESLTRSFSSLLLGDVLSRLCGWSCFRPPTMPGQGSPLVSASGQVFVYRSPSPFRVPTAPCSPFSMNAVSFFWGRSLLLLRRLDLRLDPSGLDSSAACPPLSHSTVTGRLPLSLFSHLGLQFGVLFLFS